MRRYLYTTAIAAALMIVACGDNAPTAPTAPTAPATAELGAEASFGPAPDGANGSTGQVLAVALDPDGGDGLDFASDDFASDDFAIRDNSMFNSEDPNRPPTPGKPRNLRVTFGEDPNNTGRFTFDATWDDPSFSETPTHTQYALRGRDTRWRDVNSKINSRNITNLQAGKYIFSVRWRIERDGYTVNGRMASRSLGIGVADRKPLRPRDLGATPGNVTVREINGRNWRTARTRFGWYRATADEKTGLVVRYQLDGWPEFARGAEMFDGSPSQHHHGAFDAEQGQQLQLAEGDWTLAVVAVNQVGRSPAATVGVSVQPSGITRPSSLTNVAATARGPKKSNGLRLYRVTFSPPAAPDGFGGGPLHRFEMFAGPGCRNAPRTPQPLRGEERYQPKNQYWFEHEVRPGRQLSVRAVNSAGGGSCSTVTMP